MSPLPSSALPSPLSLIHRISHSYPRGLVILRKALVTLLGSYECLWVLVTTYFLMHRNLSNYADEQLVNGGQAVEVLLRNEKENASDLVGTNLQTSFNSVDLNSLRGASDNTLKLSILETDIPLVTAPVTDIRRSYGQFQDLKFKIPDPKFQKKIWKDAPLQPKIKHIYPQFKTLLTIF
ncbi:hypothetical protein EVAR_43171_1 [Eumeta japonica]|uniref:Uncharacterized protein n=1 Tax=Eumeta variegata TaxID=151549 RepID=A0A4C1XP92_EUMVA|nr:hypothetical protein EVAR_43171_1 [Eumeta japonica]